MLFLGRDCQHDSHVFPEGMITCFIPETTTNILPPCSFAVSFDPRWTWSKKGAYGLGLTFPCIRLSIRRHISDMFGLILFKHGTSTVCTGWCTRAPHFMLWSHERWPTGKLVAILVGKPPVLNTSSTVSQTCIHRHCSTFLSYLYREASFMKMKNINSDETTRFNFTPTTFTNNLQKLITAFSTEL